jgi:shikimate dehydrogenase
VIGSKSFVLLGHPVGHSVSPAIHGAAYRELGWPHRYSVVDCPGEADVRAQVARVRSGELAGANVTVPWKRLAHALTDRLDPSAAATGVVNVLHLDAARRLVGANTDALALVDEIKALHPSARSAAVIGAGGAAQAAVVACRTLGLDPVLLSSRAYGLEEGRPLEDARSSWPHRVELEALGASLVGWPANERDRRREVLAGRLSEVDVIVQATSAGMHGAGPGEAVSDWIPWRELRPGTVALDVVYNPPRTPFLEAARRAGVPAAGGLGMLVRQAAAAMRIWLGNEPGFKEPDLGVLLRAAEQALARARHA